MLSERTLAVMQADRTRLKLKLRQAKLLSSEHPDKERVVADLERQLAHLEGLMQL